MTGDNVANRVLAIRKSLGISQRAMADKLGISFPGWQQIESGKNVPSGQTLTKLAELGFSADWLLTGQGSMRLDDGRKEVAQEFGTSFEPVAKRLQNVSGQGSEAYENFVLIPRMDIAASAGGGAFDDTGEAVLYHLAFRKEWIREIGLDPSKTEILTATGDSMEPSISNGDIMLVDRSIERIADDGVYVLVVNNNLFVKRLHTRMDGSVIVRSDNPAYPEDAFTAEAAAALKVIGRVRWVGKAL